jgi:hypothetical protein
MSHFERPDMGAPLPRREQPDEGSASAEGQGLIEARENDFIRNVAGKVKEWLSDPNAVNSFKKQEHGLGAMVALALSYELGPSGIKELVRESIPAEFSDEACVQLLNANPGAATHLGIGLSQSLSNEDRTKVYLLAQSLRAIESSDTLAKFE